MPELTAAILWGGPKDGETLMIERGDCRTIVLSWNGAPVAYTLDDAGVWRFDVVAALANDAAIDRAVAVFGRDNLISMLAIILVRRALDGDVTYWKLLSAGLAGKQL